jgi:serine phosphatase RsbU (regulator of sigma subunit)/PAS domain-containing protein
MSETRDLRAQVAALEQLLEVHERVALEKAAQLEDAVRDRNFALARADVEASRLTEVLMSLPAAVAIYDGPEHRLRFANPPALEILGRTVELGRPLRELVPEVESQGYIDLFEQIYATGEPFYGTESPVILESDGGSRLRHFDLALLPMRDAQGRVNSILSFAYEVSEKVENRRRAEALAASLSGLADVAHEINAASTLESVLALAGESARSLLGAPTSLVRIARPESVEPLLRIAADGDAAVAATTWTEATAPLADEVCERREVLRFDSHAIAARVPGTPFGSWIGVPLEDHEKNAVGTIEVVDKTGGFDEKDEIVLTQLARVASVAIENVRTYEREHRIAATLQRALLPEHLPELPDLEVSAHYLPGAAGAQVGGDWYDTIAFEDGRSALILGDVVGKGMRAAAVMSQFRVALKVLSIHEHDPARVVERLDSFVQRVDPGEIATVVYVELDPRSGGLSLVNAGHLPPLAVTPDGRAEFLETEASIPLGVADTERVAYETRLDAGTVLILYSDGLVERRDEAIDAGLERLRGLAQRPSAGLEAFTQALLTDLLPADGADDDVALLAVKLPDARTTL